MQPLSSNMADAAKKQRRQALSNFTRTLNTFNTLIEDYSPSVLVEPQFEKVVSCYEKLEAAQDEFIGKTDIDIDVDPNGVAFLDEPSLRHANALKGYSAYLKKDKEVEGVEMKRVVAEQRLLEEERVKKEVRERKVEEEVLKTEELNVKFESAKAEFVSMVDTFKGMNAGIQETLEDASDTDKRNEWVKMETNFKLLQTKLNTLSTIDPSKDTSEINDKFKVDAEALFKDTQKWILPKLKDSIDTSGGSDVNRVANTTRRETVNLPHFQGDEKLSPYLKFPTLMFSKFISCFPFILIFNIGHNFSNIFFGFSHIIDLL